MAGRLLPPAFLGLRGAPQGAPSPLARPCPGSSLKRRHSAYRKNRPRGHVCGQRRSLSPRHRLDRRLRRGPSGRRRHPILFAALRGACASGLAFGQVPSARSLSRSSNRHLHSRRSAATCVAVRVGPLRGPISFIAPGLPLPRPGASLRPTWVHVGAVGAACLPIVGDGSRLSRLNPCGVGFAEPGQEAPVASTSCGGGPNH